MGVGPLVLLRLLHRRRLVRHEELAEGNVERRAQPALLDEADGLVELEPVLPHEVPDHDGGAAADAAAAVHEDAAALVAGGLDEGARALEVLDNVLAVLVDEGDVHRAEALEPVVVRRVDLLGDVEHMRDARRAQGLRLLDVPPAADEQVLADAAHRLAPRRADRLHLHRSLVHRAEVEGGLREVQRRRAAARHHDRLNAR
mmetsp:Transcript_20557/g.63950  ORF Transcript_20557/g.63950 Transcript_20557/m.63950 type:complete len:201 (-) Transcript_20557:56-658(-)